MCGVEEADYCGQREVAVLLVTSVASHLTAGPQHWLLFEVDAGCLTVLPVTSRRGHPDRTSLSACNMEGAQQFLFCARNFLLSLSPFWSHFLHSERVTVEAK